MQSYGFVEAANPHEEYAAPALLERIRAAAPVPHSRLHRARALGLLSPLRKARCPRGLRDIWDLGSCKGGCCLTPSRAAAWSARMIVGLWDCRGSVLLRRCIP